MKLYGIIKSERASKGQGGNKYLSLVVTNAERKTILRLRVTESKKGYRVTIRKSKSVKILNKKGEQKKGEPQNYNFAQ